MLPSNSKPVRCYVSGSSARPGTDLPEEERHGRIEDDVEKFWTVTV
jgi:hypothetical protein